LSFWPLFGLFFFDIQNSDCPFGIFKLFFWLSCLGPFGWSLLKPGGELRCSGRVGSSCSTKGIRRVNLVTNPVISREWGWCFRQMEHIHGHLWHRYSITVNQVMVATVKFSKRPLWYLQTLLLTILSRSFRFSWSQRIWNYLAFQS
jgi:hypothetical protein